MHNVTPLWLKEASQKAIKVSSEVSQLKHNILLDERRSFNPEHPMIFVLQEKLDEEQQAWKALVTLNRQWNALTPKDQHEALYSPTRSH